jgi:pimeloyl-ACP methyl ester carboxylesterase
LRRWASPGAGGDPIVVLHGLLDSSEGWGPLAERLRREQIAFDLPGFGYSDVPRRGSFAGYAGDIAEAVDRLGLSRFTLLGHSLGGGVATALAELMPDRVSSLVLLAPAGFGRIHLAEAASIPGLRNVVQAALPLALASRTAVSTAYRTMIANGRTPERDVVDRVTARGGALVAGAREGTRAVVDAGRAHDGFHRRRVGYDGPVHALWGDRDRLVPVEHRHGLRTAFPHARIDVWTGMGHHPLAERFTDLLALVEAAAGASAATAGVEGALSALHSGRAVRGTRRAGAGGRPRDRQLP